MKKTADQRDSQFKLSKDGAENEQKQKSGLAWPDMMTQWQIAGAIPSPPKLGERSRLTDKINLHRLTAKQLGESSESIYSSDQLFGEVKRPAADQGLTRLVVRLWEEDNNKNNNHNNNNNRQNLGMSGAR